MFCSILDLTAAIDRGLFQRQGDDFGRTFDQDSKDGSYENCRLGCGGDNSAKLHLSLRDKYYETLCLGLGEASYENFCPGWTEGSAETFFQGC